MNNEEFRRLLATPRNTASSPPTTSNGFAKPALPSSLGSRARSLIPMTPRAVAGTSYSSSFAQQLAERNAGSNPANKKKRTAVPKGTKFATGYTDRAAAARTKTEQDEADDRASRIKALEEQTKLGQLESEVFEQLRNQITKGDVGATHLVKGLDRQLLERVRRGEDVLSGDGNNGPAQKKDEAHLEDEDVTAEDVDDAFAALEQKDIAPVAREEVVKKGEMAPPPPVAGTKRSRNDILAELKASRKAAQEAEAEKNKLGSRFKKIGDKKSKEPRIEVDEQGREVLITVDEFGRTKRKVRKAPAPPAVSASTVKPALLVPDKMVKPLGSEVEVPAVPFATPKPVEDEDDDIFAGVGDAYNPLGDIPDDDDDSDDSDDEAAPSKIAKPALADMPVQDVPVSPLEEGEQPVEEAPPAPGDVEGPTSITSAPAHKQNYFKDTPAASDDRTSSRSHLDIQGIIQRAAAKHSNNDLSTANADPKQPSTAAQRLLGTRDRDFEDLDMGFGGSRFGDEEDDDEGGGKKVKLSEWKGVGDEEEEEEEGEKRKGGGQRKRGKKKGKGGGDKNNAADVLRVMAGRKG